MTYPKVSIGNIDRTNCNATASKTIVFKNTSIDNPIHKAIFTIFLPFFSKKRETILNHSKPSMILIKILIIFSIFHPSILFYVSSYCCNQLITLKKSLIFYETQSLCHKQSHNRMPQHRFHPHRHEKPSITDSHYLHHSTFLFHFQ